WNEEDQQASDGDRFDDRPGYILKLPGQHTPAEITTAFPTVRTRALLDQLLADRFTNPDQLKRWVNGQREP
ncbi:MAG TPA: hypothetical protein VIJ65_07170, partial [Acidobacteriaceae bacterium]